jgi:two-component system response regulator FixJ
MASEQVVHVIDDDPAVRESLTFLLESGGFSVRTYDGAAPFLDVIDKLEPGCIVTDVRMPGMNGLDLARHLKSIGVDLPIIVMTGHGDVPLAVEAMKVGVTDFLEKPFDAVALVAAIRSALAANPTTRAADIAGPFEALLAQLSPRETEVLRGVIAGKANKVIAFELGISVRTVDVYRAGVMTKTGAASFLQLIRMSMSAGFS